MTSSSTTPLSASPGQILASFASQAQSVSLPDVVRSKTLIQILDSLAAISSGSALEAGRQAQAYVRARFPPAAEYPKNHYEASVLGTDIRCPVVEAALAMGMAAHADESDDSHETSQTHPGCGVLPAVLAVAQWVGSTGEEFVKAVNLGYEITIRFGEALVPLTSFAKSSLSNHAVAPLFGAAFACGSLLSFSTDQYLILLNYLAQEASGLTTWRLDKAHTLKSYAFAGMPASNAVKCVLLVHSGWTGAGDVLGTDRNFFDALSGGGAGRAPRIGRDQNGGLGREDGGWGVQTTGLGLNGEEREWKILETDIKKYSVGFPIAAPLAALEEIMARTNAVHSQISRIEVHYHPDWFAVIGDANAMPDLSLRHCLAATAVDTHLTFAASHDESRMLDPTVLDVGRRIAFVPKMIGDKFEAVVVVTLADGRKEQARQGRNVRGRIENPMTDAEVESKADELFRSVMSPVRAGAAVALARRLYQLPNLGEMMEALGP